LFARLLVLHDRRCDITAEQLVSTEAEKMSAIVIDEVDDAPGIVAAP